MSRGVNKCIFIGHCGRDPEIKYLASGTAVATVSIAITESWKDKNSGEKQERTEWVNLSFFGRLAEVVGEYVHKGQQIYVEGSMRTEKYTDKQGVEKYITKVVCNEMQMLGSKGDDGGAHRDNKPERSSRPASGGKAQQEKPPADEEDDNFPPF